MPPKRSELARLAGKANRREPMTRPEVAKLLGVSRQAVEKCEKRALRKLEKALRPARGEEVRDG